MKANWRIRIGVLSAAVISLAVPALAQSRWFTYQGQLRVSGTPVNGNVSMLARMYDAPEGGALLGQQGLGFVPVSDGLFNVILNTGGEFGPAAFDSDQRWLEFVVNNQALSPRQKLTAAPFAVSAFGLHMPAGAGVGKVLTSDANGFGSWQAAGGPWQVNGSTVYYNAGAVGVGTSSVHPNFRAQLNGGTGAWKGGLAAGGASANVVLGELNNVATIAGHNAALNAWANLALNVGGGFVGIGTAAPSWPLHVIPDGAGRGLRIGRDAAGSASVNIGVTNTTDNLPYIQSVQSEGGEYGVLSLNPHGGAVKVRSLIITGGSDIAEPYDIASTYEEPQPGMVVCIDAAQVGKLRVSSKPCDNAVAGVISGANGVNPGVVLTQKDTVADGKHPVAMNGRVWCWCDADAAGPIQAGDLLTTSDTPGHAMKVCESRSANGAIIGKAMSSLDHGKGLVLVLVSLQ